MKRTNLLRGAIACFGVAALGLALIFSGCAARTTTITNLPTGVTTSQVQNWDSAVKDLATIATITHTAQQLVTTLHSSTVTVNGTASTVLTGAAYDTLVADLAKVDQAQIEASEFLKTVPQNWGQSTQTQIAGYITAITAALADATANGLVGVKNPSAQAQLAQFLADIGQTAALISQL
jgi:hypothetical protein